MRYHAKFLAQAAWANAMARQHGLPSAEEVLEPKLQLLTQSAPGLGSPGGGGGGGGVGGSSAGGGVQMAQQASPLRLPPPLLAGAAPGAAPPGGPPAAAAAPPPPLPLLQQRGSLGSWGGGGGGGDPGTPVSSVQLLERGDSVSSAARLALLDAAAPDSDDEEAAAAAEALALAADAVAAAAASGGPESTGAWVGGETGSGGWAAVAVVGPGRARRCSRDSAAAGSREGSFSGGARGATPRQNRRPAGAAAGAHDGRAPEHWAAQAWPQQAAAAPAPTLQPPGLAGRLAALEAAAFGSPGGSPVVRLGSRAAASPFAANSNFSELV